MRQGLREYVRWLHEHEHRAERLCRAGVPTWIVHSEKGDGRLTVDERSTLEACPQVQRGYGSGVRPPLPSSGCAQVR